MFCSKVKEYLSQKGVEFYNRDVSKDEGAVDELKRMGIMTTPVTTINGQVIVGFDQQKLDKMLED